MLIDNLPPIKEVIKRYNLSAKRSLGQNFLSDLNLTTKIANLNGNITNSTILEIGSGPGALTRALLASGAKRVIAVEKDQACIPILQDIATFYPGRLEIIQQDALKFDLENLRDIKYLKIVSNLPYNIGTQLLVNWLKPKSWPPAWTDMTLMFQKEVANRIVANPETKAYGRLSILAQWRNTVKITMNIPPEAFQPKPKVHSSVVSIIANKNPQYLADSDILEKIVKTAFNQRRKMLRTSLRASYPNIEKLLEKVKISPTLRAENLNVSDWCSLAQIVKNYE